MGARFSTPSSKVWGKAASGDIDSDLRAVGRARAALGELGDGGSKGEGGDSSFADRTITGAWGCLYMGKHPA
jgi:hypothetical protein